MEKDQKDGNSNEKRSRKTVEKMVGERKEEKSQLREYDVEKKVFWL